MELIGITKTMDNLGRLQIPKELRDLFGLHDKVELIVTSQGLLIRNSQYELKKRKQLKDGTK